MKRVLAVHIGIAYRWIAKRSDAYSKRTGTAPVCGAVPHLGGVRPGLIRNAATPLQRQGPEAL